MGMDGLVFARMHNTILYDWAINKKKDFIWQPDFETTSLPGPSIFTHTLYDHYSAPEGFDFFNGGSGMKNTQKDQPKKEMKEWKEVMKHYAAG